MKQHLRQSSCKLCVDYERKLILCAPEDGKDSVTLTTPTLFAWHAHSLTTEEGIKNWNLLEFAGYIREDLVIKMLQGYKITFVNCKKIHVYGVILSGEINESVFCFDKNSTHNIQGSPFLCIKKVFISHSNKDKKIVNDLCSKLDSNVNIWVDEKDILPGDSITEEIDKGLSSSDAIILILSKNSVSSDWVRREYSYGIQTEVKVIPVRIDNCIPPATLASIKYIDYKENKEECVNKILQSIDTINNVKSKTV